MRKYKLRFNQLLFKYHQYNRKLANLRLKSKNVRRQHLLEKRIVRLYEQLLGLRRAIGMAMATATAVAGLSLATSQTTQAQSFDSPQVNPFGIVLQPDSSLTIPTFADLDGDGDMDMLSGSYYGDFYYYENTGTPTNPVFAAPVINPFGLSVPPDFSFPAFLDLDGDGDMDVLSGSYYGNFYYYENTGTANAPSFAAPVQNPFGLSVIPSAYVALPTAVDLDNDGDEDLFVTDSYGTYYYYENTGSSNTPVFAAPVSNPYGINNLGNDFTSFPAFADLDGDGDPDLMTCTYYVTFHYY